MERRRVNGAGRVEISVNYDTIGRYIYAEVRDVNTWHISMSFEVRVIDGSYTIGAFYAMYHIRDFQFETIDEVSCTLMSLLCPVMAEKAAERFCNEITEYLYSKGE